VADFGDLGGAFAYLESFFLWQIIGQVASTMLTPAFNALQQDALKAHPNMVITPDVLARAVVQSFMTKAEAEIEAAKSGIDVSRFDVMLKLADIRLAPADLAEAVLRSYLDLEAAQKEARLQGVTAERFNILQLLAGDGIGPQQAAEALRRGYINHHGKGPDSTSYDQAIAESRLHNKWGDALFKLTQALLSPADAAQAVIRNFLSFEHAAAIAELSGVDTGTFRTMTDLAGDSISPTDATIALRRGLIPENSGNPDKPGFIQAIQQGRLRDMWAPILRDLAQEWPTPTDALEARLVGQIDTEGAQDLYQKFGGDPAYFDLLFRTRGEAPTPLELGVLANRGAIKWEGLGPKETTFQQGFFEGRWRDKWLDAYRHLAKFRPPESTITLFLSHGVIGNDQAADAYAKLGMDDATAKWYIDEAHLEAYSDYRGATVNTVLEAYHEQIITHGQASQILTDLHVDPLAANILLELQDIQRAFEAMNNAISRIRTLYASRKITLATVRKALGDIGVDGTQIEGIVKSWQVVNSVAVKVLTEAQIADAMEAGILTPDEAMIELENIGYTPFDAWVLLSIKAKVELPNKPPQGPAPPQDQVIPGTT
jgi:hypothetical protein